MADRDASGRFVKGWKGGPGRPPKLVEERYRDATALGCTIEQWEKIVAAAVADCESADPSERASARNFIARVLFASESGLFPKRLPKPEISDSEDDQVRVYIPDNGRDK